MTARLRGFLSRVRSWLSGRKAPERYGQILREIAALRPTRIMEIGVWNGGRALEMAAAALKRSAEVKYYGFDLFEMMTPGISEKEFNVKAVPSEAEIVRLLSSFRDTSPGFSFQLYKGLTQQTLPRFLGEHGAAAVDLVWLDGGHSVDTVRSDWEHALRAVRKGGVILLDDYYSGMPESKLKQFGCNVLVESLHREGGEKPEILPVLDDVHGGGKVQIVRVKI